MKQPFLWGLALGVGIACTSVYLLDRPGQDTPALPSSRDKSENLIAWKEEVENEKQRVTNAVTMGQDLKLILDSIYQRAVNQGEVTARELEAGAAAIDAAGGNQDLVVAFSKRLLALQRSFIDGNTPTDLTIPAPTSDEVPMIDDLDSAYAELAATDNPQLRANLNRAIETTIALLPEEEQFAAIDRFNAYIEEFEPITPLQADLDWTLSEIHFVEGEQRQDLVKEYTDMVMQLTEAEQNIRLSELNRILAFEDSNL